MASHLPQVADGASYLPDRTMSPLTTAPVKTMSIPSASSSAFPSILPQTPSTNSSAVIAIDPVALITTECITITSAMRKHARWSQSSVGAILGGGASRVHEREAQRSVSQRRAQGQKARIPSIPDPTKRAATPTGLARGDASAGASDDENTSLAARWGLRGKKGKSLADNPLLSAFARLRRDLAGVKDIKAVDACELLHPFLQVIRSSSTSAAITSLAVVSISKFFSYNLITIRSPRIGLAMGLLAAAITNARFEASDTAADEVVLLRILRLMELVLAREEGSLLGDEAVCEMMGTGLSMCCQARLSEVLRRSAEMAMVQMGMVVFGRLKHLEVEERPKPTRSRSTTLASIKAEEESLKIDPDIGGNAMTGTATGAPDGEADARPSTEELKPIPEQQPTLQANGDANEEVKPYALPSIKELFRVLIDLLDPHNKTHTDPMRVMALRIIDVALEVAGPAIAAQPVLAELVQDDLCRHLFQIVKSDNMVLLNSSLRVAGTLLTTCRKLLKLQQELFLSYLVACLHPRVDIPSEPGIDPSLYEGVPQSPKLARPAPSQPSSGRSTPVPIKDRQKLGLEGGSRRPEAREAMVENIGTLIRIPSFMIELFINYDCEVDRQDLCEDMVGLLSRNAFPDSATWSTTNVPPLCLDSLLTFIQFMAERLDQPIAPDSAARLQKFRDQRIRKKVIKAGAAKFNDDPKSGVAFLVKNGIIKDPDDPVQVATFLRGTSHVSKRVLGEFISKRNNERLLTAFIGLFDFTDKRIDEALRDLLGSFRLPGESGLIERIVSTFTHRYLQFSTDGEIADDESAYILTYAIIMLNTELYNPNLKAQNRMSAEGFGRNLRGVNAKNDFAPEFLQEIFDAIKQDEIILPDEHDNKHAFEYAWKELLVKTHDAAELESCESNAFDAEMFAATWKPIVATLNYVFMSASDDAVFSRVVVGFDQCAQIAAKYGVSEAFDRIVYSLSQMSGLAAEIPLNTNLNTEVQAGKRRIMVSETAVRLGRDFRAQLSTVLLFRILAGHEHAVGEMWIYIVRILRNLFVNSLLVLPAVENSRMSSLGPIPLQSPSQVIDRDGRLGESGIFSTFTSYLSSYAADDPPEPSEEELENTLSSVDCVRACQPASIIQHMALLPPHQTGMLVRALLSQMEESSPVVSVKPERPIPVTARMNGHAGRMAKTGADYEPGTVFLLELATMLSLRDQETVAAAGERVTGVLQNAVRDANNLHPLAAGRVVRYLLDMLRYGFTHDFMRAPVVLHALSSFDDTVLQHTASAIVPGLAACLSSPTPLRIEITNSPDFWSILQRLHTHRTEAENVFELLASVASSEPTAVTADNYEATVSLANDFAAQGSVGAVPEQRKQNPNARRQPGQQQQRKGQGQAQPQPQQSDKATPEKPSDEQIAVQRALKALSLIYNLTALTPAFIKHSHLDRNEAWAAYWSPIFRALCAQCINPCREVRRRAVSALQRVLLSDDLAKTSSPTFRRQRSTSISVSISKEDQRSNTEDSGDDEYEEEDATSRQEWTSLFTEVLFPLILRLLKPEVYQLDTVGMGETRVQCATVLTKIFLRYLDLLAGLPVMVVEREVDVAVVEDNAQPPSSTADKEKEKISEGTREADTQDGQNAEAGSATKTTKIIKDRRPWLLDIWGKTLQLLERLMNAGVGQREQEVMTEAVSEGVKNCLLVMQGGGYLERPGSAAAKESGSVGGDGDGDRGEEEQEIDRDKNLLWRETMRRVERVVPGLWGEVFPDPEVVSQAQAQAQAQATSADSSVPDGKGDVGGKGNEKEKK